MFNNFFQGAPGENGAPGRSISEDEIKDICYNVLRNQLEELTANLQGPPGNSTITVIKVHICKQIIFKGPPGVGKRGQQGQPGPQGEYYIEKF